MPDQDYEGQPVSKYNEAVAKLQRIGGLWNIVHLSSINGNFKKWNSVLDEVWKELAADTEEDGAEEKKINEYNVEIAGLQPLSSPGNFGFNKPPKGHKEKVAAQYAILVKKELYLRRLQNQLGMGTKHADLHEDDLDM